MEIINPRLHIKRKASAEGRAPRTMEEAFPQCPGSNYREPEPSEKVGDILAISFAVALFGLVAYFGPDLIMWAMS